MKPYILLFCLILVAPFTQANDNKPTYRTTELDENVFVITRNWDAEGNFRNNVGVVIGSDGITLINTMHGRDVEHLLAEIRKISTLPVKYVINSNWDFHNTDANTYFIEQGATVIAHKNVKYFDNTTTQLLFEDKMQLALGNETVLAYRSYGHSMGHINVYLKNANVIFMSDSYRDQWMTTPGPYGHQGHIKALTKTLAMTDDNTKFVPGNTSSSVYLNTASVKNEIAIRQQAAGIVDNLTTQGKTVEEISHDKALHAILENNYEAYPRYGRNIQGTVRSLQYGNKIKTLKHDEQTVSQVLGTYAVPNGKTIEVLFENGHLYARSENSFYYLLMPVANDSYEFGWHFSGRNIQFIRDANGEITGLKFNMAQSDERYGQNIALKYLRTLAVIPKAS